MNELQLINQNGQAVTSSRQVAETFGKENKHVMEAIRTLQSQISTADFSTLFFESEYVASNGKTNPEYLMNRDGFTLLAMGFNGANALQWKIKYIQAFNEMERLLKEEQIVKTVAQPVTSEYQLTLAESALISAKASLLNAQVAKAGMLRTLLESHPSLSGVSKNLIACEEFSVLSDGKLLPLPEVDKTYSATDLGNEFGVSSVAIGKIANEHNLKIPEYSRLVLDKSRSSSKQVETFRYNELGRSKIGNYLRIARGR